MPFEKLFSVLQTPAPETEGSFSAVVETGIARNWGKPDSPGREVANSEILTPKGGDPCPRKR